MRLSRLKSWRTSQHQLLLFLLLLLFLITNPAAAQDDYATTGQDEYAARCLDDQCDCDKMSSAVICSDSDFPSIPSRQLMTLPFSVSRLTLTRNKVSVNGEMGAENFTGLASSLEELVLQECGITKLRPGVFNGMSRLIYLDLSMNKLRKLAKRQFSMLNSLEVLVLSGNRALRLDHETFAGSSASELALDECGLTELPRSVQSFPIGLRRLYLQDNRLQTVPVALKSLFDDFEDVRLRGNRWHCDSRIAWLLEIFHRRRDAFSDDPICESPEAMAGRRFSTVSPSETAMKAATQMPLLPPDSGEDDIGPIESFFEVPTTTATTVTTTPSTTMIRTTTKTTTTTSLPPTTTTRRSTTTTRFIWTSTTPRPFMRHSTVVPLSRDTISASKVAQAGAGSSSEWQIDYPSAQDEGRAREYEEAYELRERAKNKVPFPPPEIGKPVAVVGQGVSEASSSVNSDYDADSSNKNDQEFDSDGPALDDEDDDVDDDEERQNNLIESARQVMPTAPPTPRPNVASGKQRSANSENQIDSSSSHRLQAPISIVLLSFLLLLHRSA